MSKRGVKAAEQHGDALPSFASHEDAVNYYFAFRDKHLSFLKSISMARSQFEMNHTPESLKRLEAWYFELYETDSFEGVRTDRATFERCMAMYFCEVVVRNFPDAEWVVKAFVFSPGKFELGVTRGLCAYMVCRFTDHYREPNNKRRQSIYRKYKHYFDWK